MAPPSHALAAPAPDSAAPATSGPAATHASPPAGRAREIALAALRVVAREGSEAVTHRRVAAEAGVPLGSTTYWFASREALLREALRLYVAQVYASLLAVEASHLRASRTGLVDFLVEAARRELEARDSLFVEYELLVRAARDPALAAAFREYDRAMATHLAETLEKLGATAPLASARTLVALVRGFELDALLGAAPDPEDLRRRLEPVVDALVGAGSPRSPRARRRSARARSPRARAKERR